MLYKNTLIKIKKSFGRYISLLVIILVGVGFFAGIHITAPNALSLAQNYFSEHKLMDLRILSQSGFSQSDVDALNEIEGILNVIPSFSIDVSSTHSVIRVHAIEDSVNTVKLIDGHMPESNSEVLGDSRSFSIGERIEITDDVSGILDENEFIVVGLIDCALYLTEDYGSTHIGSGRLSSFIFINRDNFTLPFYTEVYIIADTDLASYLDEYNYFITNLKSKINAPDWTTMDRSFIPGYLTLKSSIDVVAIVALIIPLFFIAITVLMTSNSMARMIREERSELGTLTSLGYSDAAVVFTYILYVLSACAVGATVGFFAGSAIIPPLIFENFVFILPPLTVTYNIALFLIILAITFILMTAVTIFTCLRELHQKPANLLRPLPPKSGERIFLEKISLLWNNLSFTWKITIRNMIRYKKRAIMTIVGVAGCAALLLVAFGLRDAMNGMTSRQFSHIIKYDIMVLLSDEIEQIDTSLSSALYEANISNPLLISQVAYTAAMSSTPSDIFLVVPQDNLVFNDHFGLYDISSGLPLSLTDGEIILTQRIAKIYSINSGDIFTISDGDGNIYNLKVTAITENYVSNFIYLNQDTLTHNFNFSPAFNAIVGNLQQDNIVSDLSVILTRDLEEAAKESVVSLSGVVILIVVVASALAIVVLYNLTAINISERTREIATLKVLGFRDGETSSYIYREALILTIISIAIGLILGVFLHRFILGVIELNALSLYRTIFAKSYVLASAITLAISFIMQIITYFKLKKINMIESLKSVE